MLGETRRRRLPVDSGRSGFVASPPLLEVRNIATDTGLRDVSFAVRPGEIVGLIGLVGSGRSETLRAIFGADPLTAGEIRVGGERYRRAEPDRLGRARAGADPRGPAEAGAGADPGRPPQRLAAASRLDRDARRRAPEPRSATRTKTLIEHLDRHAERRRRARRALFRRQPAEGAPVEVDVRQAAHRPPRRAVARRRHRRAPAHPRLRRRARRVAARRSCSSPPRSRRCSACRNAPI